jgi:surface polysaccharide O-acyltransferase-like enzyme
MQSQAIKSEKVYWIEFAKVLAILTVIVVHVVVKRYVNTERGSVDWWICTAVDSFLHFGVPVFVMISGALLLDPAKNENITQFANKRLSRILLPFAGWVLIYVLWQLLFPLGVELSIGSVLKSILLGQPYYHLWFLYLIIGLYAITPFLRMIVRQATDFEMKLLITGGFVIAMVNSAVFKQQLPVTLWFLYYVPYYLLGYVIRFSSVKTPVAYLWVGYVLLSGASTLGQFVLASMNNTLFSGYFYNNLGITIVPQSILVFMILKNLKAPDKPNVFINALSPLVFGIYLIHAIFIDIASFLNLDKTVNAITFIPIVSIIVGAITIAVAYAMRQMRFLKLFV